MRDRFEMQALQGLGLRSITELSPTPAEPAAIAQCVHRAPITFPEESGHVEDAARRPALLRLDTSARPDLIL